MIPWGIFKADISNIVWAKIKLEGIIKAFHLNGFPVQTK